MTATDVLIKVMDSFASSEPKSVLVVWTDENGDINMTSNADGNTGILGLAEFAKHNVLQSMFARED